MIFEHTKDFERDFGGVVVKHGSTFAIKTAIPGKYEHWRVIGWTDDRVWVETGAVSDREFKQEIWNVCTMTHDRFTRMLGALLAGRA